VEFTLYIVGVFPIVYYDCERLVHIDYTQFHANKSSFIHSGYLYRASSRDYVSEALPAQSRTKKKEILYTCSSVVVYKA